LTACIRLFLSRPPEMLETLRNLINHIVTNENEDFDLKDRALFYCKALQYDLKELKKNLEQNVSQEEMFVEEEQTKKVAAKHLSR
jgi:AP-4 complex subunit beta-1